MKRITLLTALVILSVWSYTDAAQFSCSDTSPVDVYLFSTEQPLTQGDIDVFVKTPEAYTYFIRYNADGLDRRSTAEGVETESGTLFVRYCFTMAKIRYAIGGTSEDWPAYYLTADGILGVSQAEKALIDANRADIDKLLKVMEGMDR